MKNENSIKKLIKKALKEDIASGDITTNLLFFNNPVVTAKIIVKENGVICGLNISKAVFQLLDKKIDFLAKYKDGQRVRKGQVVARLKGKANRVWRGLLQHRTAGLPHLSPGIQSDGSQPYLLRAGQWLPV